MDKVDIPNGFALVSEEYLDDLVQQEEELKYVQEQLAEYQRIYGSLDQSDYLRRTL